MIWRLCLQKNVEVIGGEVYWTPDYLEDRNLPLVDWSTCAIEHGVDYWDSESQSQIQWQLETAHFEY